MSPSFSSLGYGFPLFARNDEHCWAKIRISWRNGRVRRRWRQSENPLFAPTRSKPCGAMDRMVLVALVEAFSEFFPGMIFHNPDIRFIFSFSTPKYPYLFYQIRVSTDITGIEQVEANYEKYCDLYPAGFHNESFSFLIFT